MTTPRALLAAAAVLLAAVAVPSSAASYETVSGRVIDAAGKPVRGAYVEFERPPDPWLWFDLFHCLFPDPTCYSHTVGAVTDAAGRYRIRLDDGSFAAEAGQRTVTAYQPVRSGSGARTVATFSWNEVSVTLPDLRFWTGDVSLGPPTPVARVVRVDPLPPEYGRPALASTPSATLYQEGRQVWSYGTVPYALPTDARTVEAGTNAVTATADASLDGWRLTYVTPSRTVTGAVRPVSRGKPCYYYGDGDRPVRLRGCRLTDGRLGADARWDAFPRRAGDRQACNGCAHRDWALLDLGGVTTVQAITVRGCEIDAAEASADGHRWVALDELPSPDAPLRLYQPRGARWVRVKFDWACSWVSEVSVFGPVPT